MYLWLYNDHKVHIDMDGAVKMKGASRIEWADGLLIVAIKLRLHDGRARLKIGPLRAIAVPASIRNNMHHGDIIHQRQPIALLNRNAGGNKLRFVHMHGWCLVARCGEQRAGCTQKSKQDQNDICRENFFHSE